MIRDASCHSGRAASLYTGGKSIEQKPSKSLFILLFLTIFVGFSLPAEARWHNTIAGGYTHSVGIKTDGTVVAWGNRDGDKCNVPVGLNGVVEVAVGYFHNLTLKSDGTVVAWGIASSATTVPAGLNLSIRSKVPVAAVKGISPGVLLLLLN